MDRRNFIKTAAITGTVAALSPLESCSPTVNKKEEQSVDYNTFELNEITAGQLQQKMQDKDLSSEEVVQMYLDRIGQVDLKGPELRSVIEINPDALEIAKQLDRERTKGKIRGPLHGIPVMIKDNIDTADKMMTTAGSMALSGFHAPADAFIVRKLREAGAVLIAKTNLSEWANIRSTRSSSGWSGRGGQCRNPYDPSRSPCGSSSGSGVAVSANLCVMAIGTETDGSIVCPSGINGIVGIKPTVGLWSRHGIIPISHSQDTPGPMARTVTDAAIFLGALAGKDEKDPATNNIPENIPQDYTGFLDSSGLQNARIGIIRDFMGFHSEVDKLMESAISDMKEVGAIITDVRCSEKRREWGNAEWQVFLYELKADMNKYLSERPNAPVRTLKDIIDFNTANADVEMPWFDQEIFLMSQEKGDLAEKEYLDALNESKKLARETIDNALHEQNLSVLVAPTNAPAWTIDLVNGDHFIGGSSDLTAISGYPSITVPMGQIHGLPVGLSFIGKAWDEATLIKLAFAFEQGTGKRIAPVF
ncbi:MAG TPA: amidase [Cyclobacteriaceae bacterium]|nr:amidase [Cyclobacteriaceae bacterium]